MATAGKKRAAKKPEKDDGCQQVVADYFDLTGKALEKQVKQFQAMSSRMLEGKYTAEEAQKDWQAYVDLATDYSQEVTKLWVQGLTRCAWPPVPFWLPGLGNPGSDR